MFWRLRFFFDCPLLFAVGGVRNLLTRPFSFTKLVARLVSDAGESPFNVSIDDDSSIKLRPPFSWDRVLLRCPFSSPLLIGSGGGVSDAGNKQQIVERQRVRRRLRYLELQEA
uniref:Secreted protein n=1 Tax=Romanomermis culicivorax TaxID=13658 RepID=A0A915IKR6_ROMCU